MERPNNVIMWAAQTRQVADAINCDGVSYVKKEFIDKKYGEVAWVFRTAYSFFISRFEQKVARPDFAESPVWLYKDPKWASVGGDVVLFKLSIPKEEILFFDTRKWSKVLNLSFIGNEKEEDAFEAELKRQGIQDAMDAFSKPFYPLIKKKIIQSWEKLFEISDVEERYVQGAVWCIKKEWIEEIIE